MKKLFTTLILMGVALCGWASITESGDGSTVTIDYEYDANNPNELQNFNLSNTSATTIVLTGDWANKDLAKIGSIVYACSNKVFLNLSACEGFVSKVKYTGTGNTDWTSEDFTYSYSNAAPVEQQVIQKQVYYFESDNSVLQQYQIDQITTDGNGVMWWSGWLASAESNGPHKVLKRQEWGYYSRYYGENNPDPSSWVSVDPSAVTDNGDGTGTAMVQPAATAFLLTEDKFGNGTSKLSGIAFPNSENFTAIPDDVFGGKATGLTSVTFGSYVEWIGEGVFKGCASLGDVEFPTSLKVINKDAFYGCISFTKVDLGKLSSLVKIGPAAFNMASTDNNVHLTVTLPSSGALKYFANQVFSSAYIETLDFTNCTGIEHFAFDGKNTFGETAFIGQTSNSNQTFTWTMVENLILPPNLKYIPEECFINCSELKNLTILGCEEIGNFAAKDLPKLETVIFSPDLRIVGEKAFAECHALTTATFTGSAVYNSDCELTNGIDIKANAFYDDYALSNLTLSNKVEYIREGAFEQCNALTTVHIPASVAAIEYHAFQGCHGLTSVVFDELVKGEDCACTDPEFFGAETQVAGAQGSGGQGQAAFNDCYAITDVYINTKAELQCANNAFDQRISWGAGSSKANFATLHFPKEKTEHYANLSHYLDDETVTNPDKFHKWLMEHYRQAIVPHKNGWYEFINAGPTAPEDGPEYQSIILRTFSDYDYSYLVPQGLRAYVVNSVVPNSKGQYEVTLQRLNAIPKRTGVILYGHPNGRTQGGKPALVLTPVKFLETGDPLFDQKYNEAGELVDCDVEYNEDGTMVQQATYRGPDQGAALCRANWNNLDEDHQIYKNYLEPILSQYGTDIKPYETVKVNGVNKVKFRNFALGRYTSTDYFSKDESTLNDETNFVGFFRMKAQSYKSGYAYLHVRGEVDEEGHSLPYTNTVTGEVYVSEYATADGGEILVKPDEPAVDLDKHIYPYYYEVMLADGNPYNAREKVGDETYNPKRWWDDSEGLEIPFTWREYSLSWGDRSEALVNPNQIAKYFGEFEENADGVVKIVIPAGNENGEYYTLQGVRVANPTKGVYIKDGKKVIIK